MYGHGLVDALKDSFQIDESLFFAFGSSKTAEEHFRPDLDKCAEEIKNSIHFFMGNYHDFSRFSLEKFSKMGRPINVFGDELGFNARAPFEKICLFFDMKREDGSNAKLCVYVHENLDAGNISFKIFRTVKPPPHFNILNKEFWTWDFFTTILNNATDPDQATTFSCRIYSEYIKTIKNEDLKAAQTLGSGVSFIVNIAFILFNTKNIMVQTIKPPVKLNKKRCKKGKQPLFEHKVLKLQLPGEKKKNVGDRSDSHDLTRLHLCRGHFKTYTTENPLFGKYTGRYWWQPQARGNKEKGIIIKDYEVKNQAA